MGSITALTADEITFFLEAFKSSEFRVLWSLREEQQELIDVKVSENILLKTWTPQSAVMAHDNVFGVFIHGGQGGTLEALKAGKPMLFRPGFADQHLNAIAAEAHGV